MRDGPVVIAKVFSYLTAVMNYFAAFAAIVMLVFVTLSSVMRYFFGSPFHFTEDLVGLLFFAMVFLTFPLSTWQNQHIRITLITQLLSDRWRAIPAVVSAAVTLAFGVWLTALTYHFTAFAYEIGARSAQSDLELTPWMAIMPLTLGMVSAIALFQLIRALRELFFGG